MCIDLKSFYASVECVARGYDPFKVPLVVADPTRGDGAITLAISPALKEMGVKNRCRIFEIPKHINYRGKSRSLSNSQILFEDYDVDSAHIVMKEMVENLVLYLVENNLYAKGISLYIRYSKDCIPATGGNMKLEQTSCSIRKIQVAFDKLYIDKVKIGYGIRQIGIALTELTYEPDIQLSFFDNHEDDENEMQLEVAMVDIRNKYGKNALLKGFNFFDKATGIKCNTMVGGHNG